MQEEKKKRRKINQYVYFPLSQISTPLDVLRALEKFTGMIGEAIRKKNAGNYGDLKFHVGGLGMLQK